MTQSTVQSFFGGGAGKSAKFKQIGDSVTGTIIAVHEPEDATDPQGKVKRDKNGRALRQVRIELQTDQRNPEIEFDDGARTLYVASYMTDAVSRALRAAGAKQPEIGGKLTVTFTEEEPNPGMNASKLYEAVYEKPSATAASAFFGTEAVMGATVSQPAANTFAGINGPVKPDGISEKAWAAMDAGTKRQLASTLSGVDEPPF